MWIGGGEGEGKEGERRRERGKNGTLSRTRYRVGGHYDFTSMKS